MTADTLAPRHPVLLVIMDGVGLNPSRLNNAVAMAETPNLDRIYASNPTCVIEASGKAVGLPAGQMGNSEVGHLTLGAGRVVRQDLVKINDAIEDGSFVSNEALLGAVERAASASAPLHLLGLVSDGGVHSHIDHLLALIDLCSEHKVKPVLHMITDGRDTAPSIAQGYLARVSPALDKAGGCIASLMGRYYALDRDSRWERVQLAWRAIMGRSTRTATTAEEAIAQAREQDETDEFIYPTVLADTHVAPDASSEIIFFNFRNDRPRELSAALALEGFDAFYRGESPVLSLTTMTRYESSYPFPVAFQRECAEVTLGEVVSQAGLKQLRSAETEKYPHVTFFFNGGRDAPLAGEQRILIDSPRVATYDLQPEMSAQTITDEVAVALAKREYSFVLVNFANGDMVGHTGVAEAVVSAVETVDACVGRLWAQAQAEGYSVVLTADHGNADCLVDPISGDPHTQHTTFPVACTVLDPDRRTLSTGGNLTSIAPTVLELMGIEQPAAMNGHSLLLPPDS